MLRGHANNVADLCWSPDDARLATASIDNSLMVWDAATGAQARARSGVRAGHRERSRETPCLRRAPRGPPGQPRAHPLPLPLPPSPQLRRLDLHTSFVKGVAWDPVGTYLASLSEDKSLVVRLGGACA